MLYPRKDQTGKLIYEKQMVGHREHLLQEHRVLFLSGVITNETELPNFLLAMDSLSCEPIRLIISSPGGDLDAAFLLYDTMRLLRAPIETLGRYCASAAAMLLAAGSKRYLMPHAKVMLHLPSNYFQRDTLIPVQEMETFSREAQKYKKRMVDVLIECGAKGNHEQILADIDRDFWLEPEETIAYGLADEIVTPEIMEEWLK